ncbi:EAL domain-containing protein [Photobacterium leiognathi]|uniref:EAL domain-containing protein n=1 Tax=Photobacterium leiognathi TaxID=553611 RepID=UPI002738D41A|nr:EAL domain-containing protein [Photobacterium leiognathi]
MKKTIEICEQTGFSLTRLTLELTEEQAFSPTSNALENLARLSLYGVKFAIDDFGTGYASLEQLIDLPISELKIDRVFISRLTKDYKHQQLTIAAIRLAQSLGFQCVAEGVENAETWEYLKELGVDVCQGFYTGRPMVIHDLNALHYSAKKSKTKSKSANSVQVESILYFDYLSIRANAIIKLLTKENNHLNILNSTHVEQLRQFLRDLPISLIILESDSFSILSKKEQEELKSLIDNRKKILLCNDSNTEQFPLLAPSVVKQSDISKTSKILSDLIKSTILSQNNSNIMELSKREKDVAQLLIAGFSNKYIAYELDISQKTVSTFKTRIFHKLGIKSLIELAQAYNIS